MAKNISQFFSELGEFCGSKRFRGHRLEMSGELPAKEALIAISTAERLQKNNR
jgi:hypothetical protein